MSALNKPTGVKTSVFIPRNLRDRIDQHAKNYSTSLSSIARIAMIEYLSRHEQNEEKKEVSTAE